jgi:microcystin-dependent protein
MPTYDPPTTKYGLPKLDGSSNVQDVDEGIGALADAVDANMAGYAEGTLSARAGVVATAGKMYRTTDTGQVFMGTGSTWVEIGVSPWQPGDLKATWLATVAPGWLPCNGGVVGRSEYPALFAAIGTSAGAGDGSSSFNLPDFRGRVFVMPDAGAGRMASNDARNQSGGAERVTLTGSESGTAPHAHASVRGLGFMASVGGGPDALLSLSGGTYGFVADSATAAAASASAAASHENMPPYLVGGLMLIKT